MKILSVLLLCTLLFSACSDSYSGELLFVEPDSTDAFNYPYFLYIPEDVPPDKETYLIIEPNNSGFADDDFSKHVEKAQRTATLDFYTGNFLAEKFSYPLLVPVFPRPRTEWNIYTHALDRDVMQMQNHPLEPIDLQLIQMFVDAQSRLISKNIITNDQFLLTGFSASGSFVNRFTLLHPEKVLAVAAGGLNGVLMLPADSLNAEPLIYPIGTSDFGELTGNEFHQIAFLETPQFYYMGELDDNDAVPYHDAYSQPERELIFKHLGKKMMPDRWNSCKKIYLDSGVDAVFKTYLNLGHKHPETVQNDVADFFKSVIKKLEQND